MREILFKAKRKDNGKWVEGDVIHEPIGMSIRHEKYGMSVRVPVDPDTLCQYTGLTDKNDKKIWENDIIKAEDLRGKIIYRNCCFKIDWIQYSEYSGKYMTIITQLLFNGKKFIRIGNLFDNPELLKVGR